MIYLLTAIGLTSVGNSTVQYSTVQYSTIQYSTVQYSTVQYSTVQYTFTHKQYIEEHNYLGIVQAVPRLCELYPGICLTTEEEARKNLSHGS